MGRGRVVSRRSPMEGITKDVAIRSSHPKLAVAPTPILNFKWSGNGTKERKNTH
jgi:hypothetical protein